MRETMVLLILVAHLASTCAAQDAASQPVAATTSQPVDHPPVDTADDPAPQPVALPATQPALPSNEDRLNGLLALIEGQNSGEVRRTVARELLLQQWEATPGRLAGVLGSDNGPARIAVALTLAELPRFLIHGTSTR